MIPLFVRLLTLIFSYFLSCCFEKLAEKFAVGLTCGSPELLFRTIIWRARLTSSCNSQYVSPIQSVRYHNCSTLGIIAHFKTPPRTRPVPNHNGSILCVIEHKLCTLLTGKWSNHYCSMSCDHSMKYSYQISQPILASCHLIKQKYSLYPAEWMYIAVDNLLSCLQNSWVKCDAMSLKIL